MAYIEYTFVWKNGNLGHCTDLDARRIDYLTDNLPHGSGFNGDWHIRRGSKNDSQFILASMTYDFMNENGYYDGVCSFTVKFPRKSDFSVGDMVIDYDDINSEDLAENECLEEYFCDIFANDLENYPMT